VVDLNREEDIPDISAILQIRSQQRQFAASGIWRSNSDGRHPAGFDAELTIAQVPSEKLAIERTFK